MMLKHVAAPTGASHPPSHLLVEGYLLEAQRPFLQAGLNSCYKAGLINLCCSGLCC